MRNIIRLYVIPVASAIIAISMCMAGADLLNVAVVVGPLSFLASLLVDIEQELREAPALGDDLVDRLRRETVPTAREDITLDDLNDLLARIDRGELPGGPAKPREAAVASDGHEDERPMTVLYAGERPMTVLYADDSVFTVIPNVYGTVERK